MAQNALWREDFGKKRVYILVTKNTNEIYKEHETVPKQLTCTVLPLKGVIVVRKKWNKGLKIQSILTNKPIPRPHPTLKHTPTHTPTQHW